MVTPPTHEQIRASVMKQLETPLPRLLSLDNESQTLAEERKRVEYGERALWGASIVMSAIGMTQRRRPEPGVPYEPLESAWWRLYDLIEKVRGDWPDPEEVSDYDQNRMKRRRAVFNEVNEKLVSIGLGIPIAPYAADEIAATDQWPQIRYQIDAKYGSEMGRLLVRDPFDGSWHDIPMREAPQSWKALARKNKEAELSTRGPRPGAA